MNKIATLLILCTALFADDSEVSAYFQKCDGAPSRPSKKQAYFNQGDDSLPDSSVATYNSPAGVLLLNDRTIPDLYLDISFIYYFVQENGLNLATSGQIVNPSGSTNLVTSSVSNGTTLAQDFEYSPGFKVGLGSNYREWIASAEYTWIRQTTNTSGSAPAPEPTITGEGAWISNNWFEQVNAVTGQGLAGTAISSEWKVGIDIVDATAGRPYYEGRNLTVSPFFGLRAAWIRQIVDVTMQTSPLLTSEPSTTVESNNSSNCWGIGPRSGFAGSCLLGHGFRLEGEASFSLLYTEFTHVTHSENYAFPGLPSTIGFKQTNLQTVRPELELDLGLGWGAYFAKQKYHLDLFAGYDFMIFWEQNMIRQALDETISGVASAPNNLYLQGLRLTARFDF